VSFNDSGKLFLASLSLPLTINLLQSTKNPRRSSVDNSLPGPWGCQSGHDLHCDAVGELYGAGGWQLRSCMTRHVAENCKEVGSHWPWQQRTGKNCPTFAVCCCHGWLTHGDLSKSESSLLLNYLLFINSMAAYTAGCLFQSHIPHSLFQYLCTTLFLIIYLTSL
jgi:hypothetical protein